MGQRGFSMLEALIATALTASIAAAVFGFLQPTHAAFLVQPEAADMQQRLRVAAGTLYQELLVAGAGPSRGPGRGPLVHYFAPVVPYRALTNLEDPPGTFRSDTLTVTYVPGTVAETTLRSAGPGDVSAEIAVNLDPGCPLGDPLCGFERGMLVLLYDRSGAHDPFLVTGVQPTGLLVRRTGPGLTHTGYPPNTTTVVEVARTVYSLRSDAASGAFQLVSQSGAATAAAPVVDHVVGLEFTYYGEAQPPRRTGVALADPAGPWTTYGPPPPPVGEQISTGGYPAGENCTFAVDSATGLHVSRLGALGAGPAGELVNLTEAQLTDGPWCPDAANPHRWDADLLRIRRVRVSIRIQAANMALRGPAGALFARGGTSRGGSRWLPDRQITFDVTPRNMGW
jgi:hypothetical protein